jgi:arginyl-tRNA--protein-N-Asp/Glu arginylyltransferase
MRPHGTRARYVVEKCRCDACRRANCDYQTAREKRKAYEAWGDVEPALVPAEETLAHLRFLRAHGIGLRQVHKVTGLSRSSLTKLAHGERRRVTYRTHDLITAVCLDDRAAGRWGR